MQSMIEAGRSFSTVFRNPNLRRLELAWGISFTGEWAFVIALAVYAYDAGGALGVGLVGLIRMLPAAVVAPFVALLGDRYRRERVLLFVECGRAATFALASVAFFTLDTPALIYALVGVLALVSALLRPSHWAIVPLLARTPEELTACNGAWSGIENLATLIGPALGGLLVEATDPGGVFAASAACSCAAVFCLRGITVEGAPSREQARGRHVAEEALAGFRAVVREPGPRFVVGLFAAQTLVRGVLNVLVVVASLSVLGLGERGFGFLSAAVGAGGLIGAFAALSLTGRRLALPFAGGLLLWGMIAVIGAWPEAVVAFVALPLVGIGNAVQDVAGLTLLQRITPDELLTRVFGVLEALALGAVAVGSILAPALISGLGLRPALVATGALLPVLVVLSARSLLEIDRVAGAPLRELALLREVPMFAPLSLAAKEQLAAKLVAIHVEAGTPIIQAGERGDRFFIVESGRARITKGGETLVTRGRGEYFGEIALLRDVPRTAAVTAETEMELYALERDDFLVAVTGHEAGREAGDAVVADRMATSTA
jgi:MFS family permease